MSSALGVAVPAGEAWARHLEELPRVIRGPLTLLSTVESDEPELRTDGPMTNREGSIIMTIHSPGGRNSGCEGPGEWCAAADLVEPVFQR